MSKSIYSSAQAFDNSNSDFSALQHYLNYRFEDPNFLLRALTHHSVEGNSDCNASRLEFLGSSCLYLAILQLSMLSSPANLRAGQLVSTVDAMLSSTKAIADIYESLEIDGFWAIDFQRSKKTEERFFLITAIAGALFLDGGLAAVKSLALKFIAQHSPEFNCVIEDSDPCLPWGKWPYRKSIMLENIDAAFPRCFSTKAFMLLSWALETHCKPGNYNQRCYQFFELGDAALRWAVDLQLFEDNLLDPPENRYLQRENKLKRLGLEARRDQFYSLSFGSQDWRRQSLDYRTHSLKNVLGAILIADGENSAQQLTKLILQKPHAINSSRNQSSVVVSHHF